MKRLALVLIASLLLAGCGNGTIQPNATSIATPTSIVTSTFTSTLPTTETPTVSPIPSATLEPSSILFDIDSKAPTKDVGEIKLGIDLVRAYMRDFLGGDIDPDKQNFTVKIAANGKGNDGSCCTGLAESGPRPFIDVLHPNWNIGSSNYWSNTDNHINAGAHEYVHAWQSSLGCITLHYQPLGNWLDEGMAQYVSINSLKHGEYVTEGDYKELIDVALANTSHENLASFEHSSSSKLDDIAFIAVVKLVALAPTGELSLRSLCTYIASGKSVDQSFENAFGITKKDFYKSFTDYQRLYATPTPAPTLTLTPIPDGMVLINGKVILSAANQKFSDYVVSFCNSKVVQCSPGNVISDDGSFTAYLESGDYKISVNPMEGGNEPGWYVKNGLVPDPGCAEFLHVGSEKEINVVVDFHSTTCPILPTSTSVPTLESSIISTGRVILSDNSQKFSDFIITFCNLSEEVCLPGVPVKPNGTFSTSLLPGKYRVSLNSTIDGHNMGWYTDKGLVPEPTCARIITVDAKHEIDITINLQKVSC